MNMINGLSQVEPVIGYFTMLIGILVIICSSINSNKLIDTDHAILIQSLGIVVGVISMFIGGILIAV